MGGNGEDDGHWDMPVGTVLVKNFSIEGKHVETRLLEHRSSITWKGFSYEWNDAGTDATLLPDNADGLDKPVGTAQPQQTWHYPSRTQCLTCHTNYAGRSLGPSTQQLNSDFAYAEGTMNQVDKFKALGLFDTPPKDIAGYPDPKDMTATLDDRARSYIQTNCAICHRPGGEFNSIDMRFSTPFDMTSLCGPVERATGIVPKYRLVPGDPSKSTVSFRMHQLPDPNQPLLRMPQIGSLVVDPDGTKLIDDWITAMPASACPGQTP
jgi:mono/diheme cytochrome c family protein